MPRLRLGIYIIYARKSNFLASGRNILLLPFIILSVLCAYILRLFYLLIEIMLMNNFVDSILKNKVYHHSNTVRHRFSYFQTTLRKKN